MDSLALHAEPRRCLHVLWTNNSLRDKFRAGRIKGPAFAHLHMQVAAVAYGAPLTRSPTLLRVLPY